MAEVVQPAESPKQKVCRTLLPAVQEKVSVLCGTNRQPCGIALPANPVLQDKATTPAATAAVAVAAANPSAP